MTKYSIKFDDSQAIVLRDAGASLAGYESELKSVANGIDTRDGTMSAIKRQVLNCAAAVPVLANKVGEEGKAFTSAVELYRKAENNAQAGLLENPVLLKLAALLQTFLGFIVSWRGSIGDIIDNLFPPISPPIGVVHPEPNPQPPVPIVEEVSPEAEATALNPYDPTSIYYTTDMGVSADQYLDKYDKDGKIIGKVMNCVYYARARAMEANGVMTYVKNDPIENVSNIIPSANSIVTYTGTKIDPKTGKEYTARHDVFIESIDEGPPMRVHISESNWAGADYHTAILDYPDGFLSRDGLNVSSYTYF
jgi:hypothetical protein